MAENSKIEWCDHTVNLWWGCSKVHAGCKNCYAETLSNRWGNDIWGEKNGRKMIKSAFSDLDKYQKQAEKSGIRLKIFVGSMMDIFEDSKDLVNPTECFQTTRQLRTELFFRIASGQHDDLIFLFLTKRPENIYQEIHLADVGWTWMPQGIHELSTDDNCWFGTSISDQKTADEYMAKINLLKNSGTWNKNMNLFLSIEPQVGPIDTIDLTHIDWVIQGGESGVKKRPFDLSWAYKMKEICKDQNTAYFFKQIDKKKQIPDDLLIREFPHKMLNQKLVK